MSCDIECKVCGEEFDTRHEECPVCAYRKRTEDKPKTPRISKARKAKAMTAPRYTAGDMAAFAKAITGEGWPIDLRPKVGEALRQAAETERALEGFRAWLEKRAKQTVSGSARSAFADALQNLDRRFGRTP